MNANSNAIFFNHNEFEIKKQKKSSSSSSSFEAMLISEDIVIQCNWFLVVTINVLYDMIWLYDDMIYFTIYSLSILMILTRYYIYIKSK